jgi:hypothetical protein
MRLAAALRGPSTDANQLFAQLLLRLGEGKHQQNDFTVIKLIGVPIKSCESQSVMNDSVKNFVYQDLAAIAESDEETVIQYLNERCILAPLNRDVKQLNEDIMSCLPGVATTLSSICDSIATTPDLTWLG